MRYSLLLVLASLSFGCAQAPRVASGTSDSADFQGKGDAPSPTGSDTATPGRTTIYLNFDGATLLEGDDDDARANISSLGAGVVPPFDPTPLAPGVSREAALQAVVDRVYSYFATLDVSIVTTRPTSGDYTMIIVGGKGDMLNRPTFGGVSPIDCGNSNRNNISFVFAESLSMRSDGLVGVAALCAHEVGHAFGLEHTDNPIDLMYSVVQSERTYADTFQLAFDEGMYSEVDVGKAGIEAACGRTSPLDNAGFLSTTLGKRALHDERRPSLAWTEPTSALAHDDKVASVEVAVSATDTESGIARIEVYKNYELVAIDDSAPYEVLIKGDAGEAAFVAVEAIDKAGNRTALTRRITIR